MLKSAIFASAIFAFIVMHSGVCAADPSFVSVQSKHSVPETIERFERAINLREDTGWRIVAKVDHSAREGRTRIAEKQRRRLGSIQRARRDGTSQ